MSARVRVHGYLPTHTARRLRFSAPQPTTMNSLVLEGNVEYVTAKGGVQQLEAMYIKGKMVRYVHISPRVDVGKSIQRHVRAGLVACMYGCDRPDTDKTNPQTPHTKQHTHTHSSTPWTSRPAASSARGSSPRHARRRPRRQTVWVEGVLLLLLLSFSRRRGSSRWPCRALRRTRCCRESIKRWIGIKRKCDEWQDSGWPSFAVAFS